MSREKERRLWAARLSGGGSLPAKSRATATGPSLPKPISGQVLGIDPSLRGTGLAVVDFSGRDSRQLVYSETVRVPKAASMLDSVGQIFTAIDRIIKAHDLVCAAMEETIYVQNFQTAQILGIARGAAMSAVAVNHVELFQYSPLRIKQSVAGFGRASKEQVGSMICSLFALSETLPLDESDAVAVALCHHHMTARPGIV